jgi:hypothetical protein
MTSRPTNAEDFRNLLKTEDFIDELHKTSSECRANITSPFYYFYRHLQGDTLRSKVEAFSAEDMNKPDKTI